MLHVRQALLNNVVRSSAKKQVEITKKKKTRERDIHHSPSQVIDRIPLKVCRNVYVLFH